jgi:hypothetical protein
LASTGSPEAELELTFPNLRASDYRIAGPATNQLNCIAWAVGDQDAWWQADLADAYWPEGIPTDGTIPSLVALFQFLGYEVCDTHEFEQNFEKVAIYGKGAEYTHAARQTADGRWTSKLGQSAQIEHATLDALTGFAQKCGKPTWLEPPRPGALDHVRGAGGQAHI